MTAAIKPMRVMIVDDEQIARDRLRRLLGLEKGVQIVAECGTGAEAIAVATAQSPDLLFLDVRMPEVDGFAVVDALPADCTPLVVFVTAFDEHATRAFDVEAVDYVLKPIDPERLHAAVERARTHLSRAAMAERHERLRQLFVDTESSFPAKDHSASARPSEPTLERILIKDGGRMFFVNVSDVDWFEAYGNYVRVHVGAETHIIRDAIGAVERSLPANRFARIHRSAIVNLDRIKEMQQWSSGDYIVVLTTGTRLRLSRSYRDNIETTLSRSTTR